MIQINDFMDPEPAIKAVMTPVHDSDPDPRTLL